MEKIVVIGLFIAGTFLVAAWAPVPVLIHSPPLHHNAEICDNALDDDGDGLIDLNDPDCECPPPSPRSYIPNPSFEERDCCPGNNSQMYCASSWIQASIPTTDFIHTCGWLGWEDFPAPLPMPDGEGCIGFRNGRPGANGNGPQANWKEYAGACLTKPLEIGGIYRLEFQVGFAHPRHSPPVNVAIYGAPFCESLPFDEEDADYGCPTSDVTRGWIELGKVRVSGNNGWQKATLEFSPSRQINAIAIGPGCERMPSQTPLYYFLDDLILAGREEFDFNISASGAPCAGDAVLQIPERDSFEYQWYKDGIALVGENEAQLRGALEEGTYRVQLSGPEGCSLTAPYVFGIPAIRTVREVSICPGEQYAFNNRLIAQSGVYLDTLKTAGNCDSLVELRLSVAGAVADTLYAKIFDSEVLTMGNRRFSRPGEYTLSFQSSDNCDSLVYLVVERYEAFIPTAFSPNDDGINDFFSIYGNAEIEEVLELQIFDRWGGLVYSGQGILPTDPSSGWDGRSGGRPVPNGVYVYLAQIVFNDGKARTVKGLVTLVR